MKTSLVLGVAAAGLLVLSGCGDDTSTGSTGSDQPAASADSGSASSSASSSASPSESESPSLEGVPLCSEVWRGGEKLPRSYSGCREGDELVKPEARMCEFGTKLYTHADHFYAVRGGTINKTAAVLDEDKGYRQALKSCTA